MQCWIVSYVFSKRSCFAISLLDRAQRVQVRIRKGDGPQETVKKFMMIVLAMGQEGKMRISPLPIQGLMDREGVRLTLPVRKSRCHGALYLPRLRDIRVS